MSRRALTATCLLLPAVAYAQPGDTPSVAPSDGHDTGLMLEIHYNQQGNVRSTVSNESPEPRGGIVAGYQLRRWSFGLGLELARWTSSPDENTPSQDFSATTFLISPGARVALGRSSDGRAELTAEIDLGFGETRFTYEEGTVVDDVSERFRLQFGPGIRYWFARGFAFGARAALRHERVRNPLEFSSLVERRATTDLVSSLSVTGVF